MTSALIEYFPDSASAVLYLTLGKEGEERQVVTTCTSPEQLWATLQAINRPLMRIDLIKAKKHLEEAKAKRVAENISIESALRALNEEPQSTIELVTNIQRVSKKRAGARFNVNTVNIEEIEI